MACHHVSAFSGTDTFTYTASDGSTSDVATVSDLAEILAFLAKGY